MFPYPKASGCDVWTALGNSERAKLLYALVEMNDGWMAE